MSRAGLRTRPNVAASALLGQAGRSRTSPAHLPGLVAYYDARDLTPGAITAWAPRASDGLFGGLSGTGTAEGSGRTAKVTNPVLVSDNTMNTSGLSNATPVGMWMIANVAKLGAAGGRVYCLARISSGSSGESGFFWFNYLDVKTPKVSSAGYVDAGGINSPPTGVPCLWIFNKLSSTACVVHRYAEDGTSTAVSAVDWSTAAKLYVGRNQADNTSFRLDGSVSALGLYSQNFDASGISLLRQWANAEFGVDR